MAHRDLLIGEISSELRNAYCSNSESVQQFEIREYGIYRSLGICSSDLVGRQGQALECDFGLAQLCVDDAIVKQRIADEGRVGPHAELYASFQRRECFCIMG